MNEITLSAAAQIDLGNSSPSNAVVGLWKFQVVASTSPAWNGSIVPKVRVNGANPPIGVGELVAVPYLNRGTNTIVAAGTGITAEGVYEVVANGEDVFLDYTHTAGSAVVYPVPLEGTSMMTASSATISGSTSPSQVVGNVASGTADSGNPVKVGGVYNTTLPSPTIGQRVDLQADSRGNLRATSVMQQITGSDTVANTIIGYALAANTNTTGLVQATAPFLFDGTQWVRSRGTTSGTYVVASASASTEAGTLSITTGGVAQQVFASNTTRRFLILTNTSDTAMFIRLGASDASATVGMSLAANGGQIIFTGSSIPSDRVSVFCATTGKTFYAVQG